MTATILTITDLTRMSDTRVCIAGITDDKRIIRPELEESYFTEDWLFKGRILIIKPFARVKFDLIENRPDPPHTEDWLIHPDRKVFMGELNSKERQKLLALIAHSAVTDIFDAEIRHATGFGFFVEHGQGTRSLGTLEPKLIIDFVHTIYSGPKYDYRLEFRDLNDINYRLGVTDLAFRNFVDHLRVVQKLTYEQISGQITELLKHSQVFLQLGLARAGWVRHPGYCHLQINGIHTFPDYLDGRCFADFRL
jgi:hypothetical protein